MLQLYNIRKSYTTAGFTQNALDGVSIAFRENEFAAVLGPSGSGKTTMLNIVGGLDRYDEGDLEIDNISTNKYKASDWDTYRNNRIGFVFQSYNLIPHQSVLANVELALTLSGVSRSERKKRAKDALAQVGLVDHIRKKPGQLSGGQMQRVAIARALINDPEILLADEPTGALDSTTSKQVMELLTQIAKNRLVIMVTHNNELAEKYANRIIHLKDGKVASDSRPYDPATEDKRVGREPRKAGMSFMTAIALSFSNLMTKKGRTFTTAFAGSIGIIGIATILAFSNGINTYIRNIEEETLSIYPLMIQDQGFNISAFFGGDDHDEIIHGQENSGGNRRERPPDTVREMQVMEMMFSLQNNNDLASLKVYLDENSETMQRYATTIHYMFDITPQIFLRDTSRGADQIHPDSIFSGFMGSSAEMGPQANMGLMPGMNVFSELPNNPDLYESQYDVLAGRWPENYDEAVLVLSFGGRIMDFTLFSMGIRDREEMRAMLESVLNRTDMEIDITESDGIWTYDELMTSFKVIHPTDLFRYDDTFNVWVDRSSDAEYMVELVQNAFDLSIVGIVQPAQDANTTVLSVGVNYTPDLIQYLMHTAADAPIVKEQLANSKLNVISGNTFEHERENLESSFDFSRIMSIDEQLIQDAMNLEGLMSAFDFENLDLSNIDLSNIDMGGLDLSGLDFSNIDLSDLDFSDFDLSNIDLSDINMSEILAGLDLSTIQPPPFDIAALTNAIATQVNIPPQALTGIMTTVMTDFFTTVVQPNPSLLTNQAALTAAFTEYMNSTAVQTQITNSLAQFINPSTIEADIATALQEYMAVAMQEYMSQISDQITEQMSAAIQAIIQSVIQSIIDSITSQITALMQQSMAQVTAQINRQMQVIMRNITAQIEKSLQDVFEQMGEEMQSAMEAFDSELLADAFQFELSEEAIFELMMAMMNPTTTSYEQNLSMFGYADATTPNQILIYPRSFEAKQSILDILDNYNAEMEESGHPEKVVHFTDIVGLMMSTVTDIIDMVSYALVSFVSVALIVSSIMIGVITFISVLERKKEIGILRAVGASKGNIRLVFNAETLIIGFVAGVIGVFATFLIAIVANIIILNRLGISNLVLMPPVVPIILVAISMFLTYIAGLLPASAAASKPPVDALRSE
ncbi:MAG: ATP-binding cassette domain-containing protein [Oscillospiraceae bacterium]|nr:ATP-binding cassette domain-containing protein [Oscillospiraceae bacterium]